MDAAKDELSEAVLHVGTPLVYGLWILSVGAFLVLEGAFSVVDGVFLWSTASTACSWHSSLARPR